MEARSNGHFDACVERRRDALLGRCDTGAERGCALRRVADTSATQARKDKRRRYFSKFFEHHFHHVRSFH